MADQKDDRNAARTGSDVQQSQSGGDSGQFGGNRDQQQSGQGTTGGQQMGGGATPSDRAQGGGSSGGGGYGSGQNQQFHQGQRDDRDGQAEQSGSATGDEGRDRGERFDEEQGGGRA